MNNSNLKLSKGQIAAIEILTYNRLGHEVYFVNEAKLFLKKDSIEPILIPDFLNEAHRVKLEIRDKGIISEAIEVSKTIIKESIK